MTPPQVRCVCLRESRTRTNTLTHSSPSHHTRSSPRSFDASGKLAQGSSTLARSSDMVGRTVNDSEPVSRSSKPAQSKKDQRRLHTFSEPELKAAEAKWNGTENTGAPGPNRGQEMPWRPREVPGRGPRATTAFHPRQPSSSPSPSDHCLASTSLKNLTPLISLPFLRYV